MNSNSMTELTHQEMAAVSGAGIGEMWDEARRIIRELPKAYEEAIDSLADMMCRATRDC